MTEVSGIKTRAADLYRQNHDGSVTRQAIDAGLTFSAFLEREDPTTEYGADEKLDAFGRQMRVAGIKTASDPVNGIWADKFSAFDQSQEARALGLEWIARRYREVLFDRPANTNFVTESKIHGRAIYTSSDDGLGSLFRPYFDVASQRSNRVQPKIPLSRLVAVTTNIEGDSYRAAYMVEPTGNDARKVRVGEGAEIPLTKITAGSHTIDLYKYGRGFEMTYEALRNSRIDKVAFWIQRLAVQNENDKVAQALETLINGDGNANAAVSVNISSFPGGTAGTLDYRSWLAFKESFGDTYSMDLAVTTSQVKPDIFLLDVGSGNVQAQSLAGLGGVRELGGRFGDVVEVGTHSTAPANKIIGIDTSAALEHAIEIGSTISESTKFITRQTDVMVMTETEAFAVFDQNATRVLNIAA